MVLLQIPPQLKAAGQKAAQEDTISLSAYIRLLIVKDLASRKAAY